MADPNARLPNRPMMLVAIEHLDQAFDHMNSAMNVLSNIVMDLQRGADFIVKYRDSLVKTVEETGGDVTASIETQIKEFIPLKHRPAEAAE
jgi:hypothetical protein